MTKRVLTPLATARAKQGLSLADLSLAVGYDRGGLSRIERGLARPRPVLANKLVKFFNGEITRDQIMFPEEYTAGKKPVRSAALQEAL